MMKPITHRDEVHGDENLDQIAAALLDTPALQRLGRVYQLGFAHLVYRGATHTRLSHVLGTYHMASKIVTSVRDNYTQGGHRPHGAIDPEVFLPCRRHRSIDDRWEMLRYLVSWAGLLHDVAHIPFGHTLEDEYSKIYEKHDDFSSPRLPYIWWVAPDGRPGDIFRVFNDCPLPTPFINTKISGQRAWQTVLLICTHKETPSKNMTFKDELASARVTPFTEMLTSALNQAGDLFHPYMADIVANTISADYLDYLRRDPANLGLDVVRHDRVVSRFRIGKDRFDQLRMALPLCDVRDKPRPDTATGVTELVRQRYRLAEIVYYHKTKVAASAMLAKVLTLVGSPRECPQADRAPLDNPAILVDQLWAQNESERIRTAQRWRSSNTDLALLDVRIGDETLLYQLNNHSWESFEKRVIAKDRDGTLKALRASALLQAIVERRLYKVAFTIDKANFATLKGIRNSDNEVERLLAEFIDPFRGDPEKRNALETAMATEAGCDEDAFIVYVPPRKVQAKGIDVGVFDNGLVVSLGSTDVVQSEVSELNRKYKNLWRMIVFVNPMHRTDPILLSKALDICVDRVMPSSTPGHLPGALRECAWFPYIERNRRLAAVHFREDCINAGMEPDWTIFSAAQFLGEESIASRADADRCILAATLFGQGLTDGPKRINEMFPKADGVFNRVEEMLPISITNSREGTNGISTRTQVIRKIAEDLLDGHDMAQSKKSRTKRR